jgi:hypothetical protein
MTSLVNVISKNEREKDEMKRKVDKMYIVVKDFAPS